MGGNEKFCLRWNDFENNISLAFREIREEKDFFDITLSCGERQIQAHKLILSACSPFFRTVLKQNPHQHPLLYLKGVEFSDLQSVLNFMYHGEVNVAQEELNSFLSVAEELQVKGLTQNISPSNSTPKPEPPSNPVPRPRPPPRAPEAVPAPRRPRPEAPPASQPPQPDDIQEIIPVPVVKIEPQPSAAVTASGGMMDTMGTEVASVEEAYGEEGYDDYGEYEGQGYGDNGEGDGRAGYAGQGYHEGDGQARYGDNGAVGQTGALDTSSHITVGYNEAGMKMFTCQMCGKSFKKNAHVKTHIENVHTGEQVQCGVCSKFLKNKQSLLTHCSVQHGLTKDQIYY